MRNPIGVVIDACRGRHTVMVMAFFISGHVMHWFGKLTPTYIGYMAALMSFVLGKSVKDDYFAKQNTPDGEGTPATASATPPPSNPQHGAQAG